MWYSHCEVVEINVSNNTAEANTNPIACANLLGIPGTCLGGPNFGAMNFIDMNPIGLKVGPVKTRAKNP